MATNNQNVIKAKSETNQRASVSAKYGNDVAEVLFDEEENTDWEFVESFKHTIGFDD